MVVLEDPQREHTSHSRAQQPVDLIYETDDTHKLTNLSPIAYVTALGQQLWLAKAAAGHRPRWPQLDAPRRVQMTGSSNSSPVQLALTRAYRSSRGRSILTRASPPVDADEEIDLARVRR
jgi:hypothetical protein